MAALTGKVVLSGMVEKVAFVNKWPMLIKATSDDEIPTPGYLYKEVTDLSYVSTGYCTSLLSFLVDRLEKSSFHIKVKVLRVMKHVVEHGHSDFKKGLRRQASGIQNACKYSGDADLLHGNAPYAAVRKTAMELCEVLFDTEQQPKSPKRSADGKVQTVVDQNKIQGFGYSPTHQPHATKSLTEVIKGGVEQLASNLSNLSTETRGEIRRPTNDYRPITGHQGAHQRKPMRSAYHGNTTGRMTADSYKAVNVGEEMKADGDTRLQGGKCSSSRPGGSWGTDHNAGSHGSNDSSGHKSGASTDMSEKLASVAVEDWSQEIKLVEDFISSISVKATPSREELNQFSKRCATSSSEKVLELLDNKLLDNSQPNMQMRSLCAIEGIIREDLVAMEKAHEMLQNNLRLLLNSRDRLVQAKAKKISKQLERLLQEANEMLQRCRTSPLHQGTTPLHQGTTSDTLVQVSPQQETLPTMVLEDQVAAQPAYASNEPSSLFSGMSFGQQKCASSVGLVEDDPFGIRAASDTPKSKDTCQHEILSSLERKSADKNVVDHTEIGEDVVVLSSLESHSITKETFLDTILDLSCTEQATLKPKPSGNIPILSGERTSAQNTSDSSCSQLHSQLGRGQTNKGTVSAASRTSYADDLLASIDPLAQSRTTEKEAQSLASTASSVPVDPTQHMPKNNSMEDITRLYPQLSKTRLSGASAVPLNLSKKPQMKSFAFVETEEDKKEKRTKAGQEDAFGFVHDAMAKASKR